jgi:hypothetical protein
MLPFGRKVLSAQRDLQMANLVTFIIMFHNLILAFTKCSNIFIYVRVVVGLAYMEEAEKYISKFYDGLKKKGCVIFVNIG